MNDDTRNLYKKHAAVDLYMKEYRKLLLNDKENKKIVSIGECGLDWSWAPEEFQDILNKSKLPDNVI